MIFYILKYFPLIIIYIFAQVLLSNKTHKYARKVFQMNLRRKKSVIVPPFMRRITPYNDMYSSYTTRFIHNNPYQRSARRKTGGTPVRNQPSTERPINPAEPVLESCTQRPRERFMCAERGTQTGDEEWQPDDECCSVADSSNCVTR